MFEFTETIVIEAPAAEVWEVMRRVDEWWPPSNHEHISLEHLDDRPVTEIGAHLRIREKIAGIPGEAVGTITDVIEGPDGAAVTWDAQGTYRWLGVRFTVDEGVTWRVEPRGTTAAMVSAQVWASVPPGIFGRIVRVTFIRLLNGLAKDREHARSELRYLKRIIEGATGDGGYRA